MPPAKLAVGGSYHEAAYGQADGRGAALGEIQQPERHADQRDVDKDDPPGAPIASLAPARDRIPEEEYPAYQAHGAKHVLAGRYTRELLTTPRRKRFAKVRVVLD